MNTPILVFSTLLLAACNPEPPVEEVETGDPPEQESLCPELVEPPCVDSMILDLSLQDDEVSDGEVTTVLDDEDFVTTVDASAGGMYQASSNPWVYVRFDDDGAVRVDLDDEAALESREWHLAARRYLTRLNSGDGGPSCVGAMAVRGTTYDQVDSIPDGAAYAQEDFYDSDCRIIEDSSGLPDSPRVALDGWWTYQDCVRTTSLPFLVELDDGRVLKLVIETYYGTGQDECNQSGSPGGDSGILTIRWRFLD